MRPPRTKDGTDTWMTSRWEALPGSVTEVRGYLGQLPRDVAEKIADMRARGYAETGKTRSNTLLLRGSI